MSCPLHTRDAAWYFGRVCLYNRSDDKFRKPWHILNKFIFAHPVYFQEIRVKFFYEGHRVKVTAGSQEQKRSKIPIPGQCKTSIGHNSGSIKHTVTKFVCSMGFSDTAVGMV